MTQSTSLTNAQFGDHRVLDLSNSRWARIGAQVGELARVGGLGSVLHLRLDRNNLRALPVDITHLTNLRTLSLDGNHLSALVPQLTRLKELRTLHLRGNNLTDLPPEITQLTNLRNLALSATNLAVLPPDISRLSKLETLYLEANYLTDLPSEIGALTNLHTLYLDGNQLTRFPLGIAQLKNLKHLYLDGNQLTELPPEIGRLENLRTLDLQGNALTHLPSAIAGLTNIEYLYLAGNQLIELPSEIGQLTNLRTLEIRDSYLTTIPPQMTQLTKLWSLDLHGNQLTELPPEIGQLANLQTLNLQGNDLTELPPNLADLGKLQALHIRENPLSEDLQAAAKIGIVAVRRYLASLHEASARVWQAKLLLVGEGEVGKSTLLGALLGEPFQPNRESTHGLEVKSLAMPNPNPGESELELFAWDFAGQPVYRPTHQIFFTTPALYIVVWKPRVGSQQSQVDYWLRMIRLRASDGSRALVVATHGGPTNHLPDIREEELRESHGDLIAGFFHVDSEYPTEHDFPELRATISREVAQLPGVGRASPRRWERARAIADEMNEPFMTLDQFIRRCTEYGVDTQDATSVVQVSAVRGEWLLVGDERLPSPSDLVILKPQWLAKAISYVLEDKPTRDRHGILHESDLERIWNNPDRDDRYPAHLYLAFVLLMERYDLAYRINEPAMSQKGGRSWLIAQLVAESPDRERLDALQLDGREASVIALTFDGDTGRAEIAEGLIYRLIVRFSSLSLGVNDHAQSLHWSSGVVLRDRRWGYAIVRARPDGVHIQATGLSPETMTHIIVSDIERLCEGFWPGIRVEVAVPCISNCGLGEPGRSSFQLEKLYQLVDAGITKVPCSDNACTSLLEVDEMLGGRSNRDKGLAEITHRLERIEGRIETILDDVRGEVEGRGMNAEMIFDLVENILQHQGQLSGDLQDLYGALDDSLGRILSAVAYDLHGPNLIATYDLEPENRARRITGSRDLRAVLYCEHSKQPIWVLEDDESVGRYTFKVDGQLIAKIRPYAGILGTIVPKVSALARASFEADVKPETWQKFRDEAHVLDKSASLTASVISVAATSTGLSASTGDFDAASNDARSILIPLIKGVDPGFGGLKPVVNPLTKRVTWVHPQFGHLYQSYEFSQLVPPAG